MTDPLLWAILVLIIGLMLLVAEVFIPSGGVLGILAGVALIGSIVLGFRSSTGAGIVILVIIAVALPTVLVAALEIWPKTPFGRRFSLSRPSPEEVDPHSTRDGELQALVGKVGRTITPLRPAGMTEFSGRRVDTLAEGLVIEAGTLVRVVAVQGRRVVVRKVEDESQA
jgi:membrane-bound ClpP family serine protease